MNTRSQREKVIEIALHIVVWSYIFSSPLFTHPQDNINWERVAVRTLFSSALFLTFYLNYFWFIPRFFLQKRFKTFFLSNLATLLLLSGGVETIFHLHLMAHLGLHVPREHHPGLSHPANRSTGLPIIFFIRNMLTFAFAWGAAMAVRLSLRWYNLDRMQTEAELGRTAAELLNLKSQISPHFLLNTLNNIYALTAFDITRAQTAILELSRMLRYQLYEEQETRVSLQKEAEFLLNYIALMKLRLARHVEVDANFSAQDFAGLYVAPHIFISLVENAFKHGVSPTQPSFIHVSLTHKDEQITFCCHNSNFPKNQDDKSPGGIGLKQVERLLQLYYPNGYYWQHGTNTEQTAYRSTITLKADNSLLSPPSKPQ